MNQSTLTKLFAKHIALPQDHGSWIFLLLPLTIGLILGGRWSPLSDWLVIGALAAFLLRQPVSIAVKIASGRRNARELPAARFWMLVYGIFVGAALTGIIFSGGSFLLPLALPAIPVFIWHLMLVRKRAERRQMGVEIIASGVLALSAPAAMWAAQGNLSTQGCFLWLLIWLQNAAAIVSTFLLLEQRGWKSPLQPAQSWLVSRRAVLCSTFNVILTLIASRFILHAPWLFIAFLPQWVATLWSIFHPAIQTKPTTIGFRQFAVSLLFAALFVLTW